MKFQNLSVTIFLRMAAFKFPGTAVPMVREGEQTSSLSYPRYALAARDMVLHSRTVSVRVSAPVSPCLGTGKDTCVRVSSRCLHLSYRKVKREI